MVKSLFRRRNVLILAAAAWFLLTAATAQASGWRLLEERETLYNNVFVYFDGTLRIMTFGHNKRHYVESRVNPKDEHELPVPYTRLMTMAIAYRPAAESLLMIGLGGGRTSWYLHRFMPDLRVTAVELDPQVIELAEKYFGLQNEANYRLATGDGRIFLMKEKQQYDLILIDAYRGPFVPFHLLTREFFQIVKQRLRPGGRVVQNIEPTTMLFDSAVATLKSVFENLDFYPADGNVVAVAYDGPKLPDAGLMRQAKQAQARHGFRYSLPEMAPERRNFFPGAEIKPLTDDFAPVNSLKSIKKHNLKWD